MKNPEEYATELLARKGGITEFHLAHAISRAMRDCRDACARAIDLEAEQFGDPLFVAGMHNSSDLLRNYFVISGPVKATMSEQSGDRTAEETIA